MIWRVRRSPAVSFTSWCCGGAASLPGMRALLSFLGSRFFGSSLVAADVVPCRSARHPRPPWRACGSTPFFHRPPFSGSTCGSLSCLVSARPCGLPCSRALRCFFPCRPTRPHRPPWRACGRACPRAWGTTEFSPYSRAPVVIPSSVCAKGERAPQERGARSSGGGTMVGVRTRNKNAPEERPTPRAPGAPLHCVQGWARPCAEPERTIPPWHAQPRLSRRRPCARWNQDGARGGGV
jgi:hypothetical protein